MSDERGLAESLDQGLGPLRRGAVGHSAGLARGCSGLVLERDGAAA